MEYHVPQYITVVRGEAPKLDVRRVVIHAGVTEIAEDAFRDWTGLEEVVFELGSRLERIGDRAFAGTALRKFMAPATLNELGDDVFMGCRNLKTVRLNEDLESIGDRAFQNSGVEEIRLPSSLLKVGKNAFAGCKCLERVEMGADSGALAVAVRATGGKLEVNVKREITEESSKGVQIEVEDENVLAKQLEERD